MRVGERLAAQVNFKILDQRGALAVNRQVQLILAHQHLDDELVGKLALGHNLRRGRSRGHSLFLLAMGAALLPLDHPDPELGRLAGQFLAGFVANDRPLRAAFLAGAILRDSRG